jgi:hypothetical protein
MSELEQRLLDFVASLIVEVARAHSRVTEAQIALWPPCRPACNTDPGSRNCENHQAGNSPRSGRQAMN